MTIKINPEKIGKLIGPGGKMIKKIQEETGTTIEIEDDGTVQIACIDAEAAKQARDNVESLSAEVKVGRIYTGHVVSIKEFGAFIEIAPDTDGLCHVSELSDGYVKNVEDVVKIGDEVRVKCILIDDQGRIKLSRKAVMKEEGISDNLEPAAPDKQSTLRSPETMWVTARRRAANPWWRPTVAVQRGGVRRRRTWWWSAAAVVVAEVVAAAVAAAVVVVAAEAAVAAASVATKPTGLSILL